MSWIGIIQYVEKIDMSTTVCGENLLVNRFRVTFILARSGDGDATKELEEIVAELASRDIAITRQLRPYLARCIKEAVQEERYEHATVCRDMLALYDQKVLSNH